MFILSLNHQIINQLSFKHYTVVEQVVMLQNAIQVVHDTHLKYGWLGDMVICSTSLVMSSSEKASFRLSDCRITFKKWSKSSYRWCIALNKHTDTVICIPYWLVK